VDADGHQLPARWYCPQCEAEWPAAFEHDHTPVQRFSGYDAGKAVVAARRATELETQQRRLALVRAGLEVERESFRATVPLDNLLNLPRNRTPRSRSSLANTAS
jgi:hypothetical protein